MSLGLQGLYWAAEINRHISGLATAVKSGASGLIGESEKRRQSLNHLLIMSPRTMWIPMLTHVVWKPIVSVSCTPINLQMYIRTMTLTTESKMYPMLLALLLTIIQMAPHIYFLHESLYYGTKIQHSLINPNQVRFHGLLYPIRDNEL